MPLSQMPLLQPVVLIISQCFLLLAIQGRLHNHILMEYQFIHLNRSDIASPPESAPSPAHSIAEPPMKANFVLDVTSFGAIGDGLADDTQPFKLAWDSACQSMDPPVLLVPSGLTLLIQPAIFTGPCRTWLVLQIDGTLTPPDGPDLWPQGFNKRQWLVFYDIHAMIMQGSGVVDGRGDKWWNLPCKPHKGVHKKPAPGNCDSPVAIRFFMSSNLTVQGLRVKNSPQFHFRFDNCQNVLVDSLNIIAPASSPNTDGIHLEDTKHVQIQNSAISNGDDCVSIGAGSYDVHIKNITCGPSHGISIGSLGMHNSRACVSNITVVNSVIKNSDNGARIKTWQGGSGSVSGITFSNIHMENVRNPIIIDQYYCQAKNCINQTSAVIIGDILYTNITGTYDIRSPPMHFACSDSIPCTRLKLADVELLPSRGNVLANPFCWNAYGTMQTITVPPAYCLLEGFPILMKHQGLYRC